MCVTDIWYLNDPLVICGCVMKIQHYQFDPLWGTYP